MSSTESKVFTKKADIPMRTETEMFDVILQTAKVLQVDAVAMSGSRTDTRAPKGRPVYPVIFHTRAVCPRL